MSGADEELTQMSDIIEELMSGMDEELVQYRLVSVDKEPIFIASGKWVDEEVVKGTDEWYWWGAYLFKVNEIDKELSFGRWYCEELV